MEILKKNKKNKDKTYNNASQFEKHNLLPNKNELQPPLQNVENSSTILGL